MATIPVPRVLCVVMDGIGVNPSRFGNAVALARTPALDRLRAGRLVTTLKAHGTAVGLPSDDDIGNSEVGHNALGAGRIFAQGAKLVRQALADGTLFKGAVWRDLNDFVARRAGTLHFIGLLSDGNVHSHEEHLYKMLRESKRAGRRRVRVHPLFDGRDVGEKTAEVYVDRLERVMAELRGPDFDVEAASAGGRMAITMDRYGADWPMVKRGWDLHARAIGPRFASLAEGLAEFRKDPKLTDQNLPGFVVARAGAPLGPIVDGDGVVFFNFRGDRAIEISRAFTEPSFSAFDRGRLPDIYFAGMMEYDGDQHIPPRYLVEPPAIDRTLTETLLGHGCRQFACSETQKFGHVTYFWNGNRSGYVDERLEEYVEVPSDAAHLFAERPQMKAQEIADVAIDRMRRGTFDFGRINFANGDMVGHTGDLAAAIAAVEAVDLQLGRLIESAAATGTTLLVTADHGNADEMFDAKEKDFPDWERVGFLRPPRPKTAHTLAPVPFIIVGPAAEARAFASIEPCTLGHVAATVLDLMGLPRSPEYLPSLIR